MSRREFSSPTKKAAWARCEGQCEYREGTGIDEWRCQKMLREGDIFYDHIIPDALGGDNTLSNCQVLCRAHHDPKTRKIDVPRIAKMKRQQTKAHGIRKRSSFQTSRAGQYKQKIGGEIVRRETSR